MSDSNGDLLPALGHRSPTPDVIAPDGSEIRLLLDTNHGATKSSLVEVTLGPGEVTRPPPPRILLDRWMLRPEMR